MSGKRRKEGSPSRSLSIVTFSPPRFSLPFSLSLPSGYGGRLSALDCLACVFWNLQLFKQFPEKDPESAKKTKSVDASRFG